MENAAIDFIGTLPTFILGIQERVCIDINVLALRDSVEILRSVIRSNYAAASLAIISGALCAYSEVTLDSIELVPEIPEQRLALFNDFVDDELYKTLSSEAYNLGIPHRVKRATNLIRRSVRELLDRPFARKTAQLSTRVVATASQIPITDSDLIDLLNNSEYFPPIIPIRHSLAQARAKWRSQRPNVLPHPSLTESILSQYGTRDR